MKIYTSYYSKVAKVDTSEFLLVQISVSKPAWFTKPMVELKGVYPPWKLVQDMKNGAITEAEYGYTYGRQLARLGSSIKEDIEMLCSVNGFEKCILVCWEAPDKFCHRRQLGEFLDCDVTELTDADL